MIGRKHLLVIYCIVTIGLIYAVISQNRGHQDLWILQDVFIPTVLYVIAFEAIVVTVNNNKLVAALSSSFLIVLNAIPNLKYELFYGVFDAAKHYGFITRMLSSGHVPQTGAYADQYGDFPGMHILIGNLSLAMGISPNDAIKLFTSVVSGIIPLMTYLATNHVFRSDVQRAMLVASGLPAASGLYSLSGATFGYVIFFGFLCVLFRRNFSNHLALPLSLILLILGYGLLFSHPVSLIYLLIALSAAGMGLTLWNAVEKRKISISIFGTILLLALSFLTIQAFEAVFVLATLIGAMRSILLGEPLSGGIPSRFFQLPLSAQLNSLLVIHAGDAMFALLSLVGFIVLLRKFRPKNKFVFGQFYLPSIGIFAALTFMMFFQLAMPVGGYSYARPLGYMLLFQPFLVGFTLRSLADHFKQLQIRKIILAAFLIFIVTLSFVQFYDLQAIVPRANVLSTNLPENEYVFDFRMVNTICNVEAIVFAQRYSASDARITSDVVTRSQIFGFTNEPFSDRHTWYSPLAANREFQWDIFVLHYDGIAGPLNEPVEYRTREYVETIRDTWGNVVYDNGGCFIIASL